MERKNKDSESLLGGKMYGATRVSERVVFFFKQKTAYEVSACLVGSAMCVADLVLTDDTIAMQSLIQLLGIPVDAHSQY